jgi:hypothetical protein
MSSSESIGLAVSREHKLILQNDLHQLLLKFLLHLCYFDNQLTVDIYSSCVPNCNSNYAPSSNYVGTCI